MKTQKGEALNDFDLRYEKLANENSKLLGADRLGDRYFRIISTRPLRSPIERVRRAFRKNNKVKEKQ